MEQTIRDWLIGEISTELAIPAGEIDVEESLFSYGLGSVEAVRLVGELRHWLGRKLPSTLAWDYPTIAALAAHLTALPPTDGPAPAAPPTRDDGPSALVVAIFEAQARRRPRARALSFKDTALTYEELNARANGVAHHLRALGVTPATVVGLYTTRSLDMVVGLLGILKAGAAYLPIAPDAPPAYQAPVLREAGVTLLLTERGLQDRLPAHAATVVYMDADAALAGATAENPPRWAEAGHLAAVFYQVIPWAVKPRQVAIEHRALAHLHTAQTALFGLGPEDRVLQFARLDSPAATFEILLALLTGAALHIAPPGALQPGPLLQRLLQARAITAALLPLEVLARLPADGLPALRTLIMAGNPATLEGAARWAGGRRLFQVYGPPEAGLLALAGLWTQGEPAPALRAAGQTEAAILDGHGALVDRGVAGELHLSGPGLARGYLHRPQVTRAHFIPAPGPDAPGARRFRTGERARYRPDGAIELLGPITRQAWIAGQAVPLDEIAAVLHLYVKVREAVVAPWEPRGGETRLVAYLAPRPGAAPTPQELRAFLQLRLPTYPVPAAFVLLDALPRAPGGQVDYARLPPPPESGQEDAPLREAAAEHPARDAGAAGWASSLVALQDQGGRPPLFCIPGAGGSAGVLLQLARSLGAEQPVYGGEAAPLPRIEAQAARYLGDIRAIQPAGPYYLAGYSYGGFVAFEIAQQLHALGERVALLALFDTYGPGHPLLDLPPGPHRQALPAFVVELLVINQQAQQQYRPRIYPGAAVLFRAATPATGAAHADPAYGWGAVVAGGVRIEDVPGDHDTLIKEPHVRVLVERLRPYLG